MTVEGNLPAMMAKLGTSFREAGDRAVFGTARDVKARIRGVITPALGPRAGNAYRFDLFPKPDQPLAAFGHSDWYRGKFSEGGQDVLAKYATGGPIRPDKADRLWIPQRAARKYDRAGRRATIDRFESITGLELFFAKLKDGRLGAFVKDAGINRAGKAYRPAGVRNRKRLRAADKLRPVLVFVEADTVNVRKRYDFESIVSYADARLSELYLTDLGALGALD